jgi:hypothetical protein
MNNNNIISFMSYLLNEGNFDHLENATDEQKQQLERIRNKNQTADMKDSWTETQRLAWAMGETDSPDYPENASEYEDRLRDQGVQQGREDFARRREEEAQKRKDNPNYDAIQRMRADEKYFDRASDDLIASSGPRHSDRTGGRAVTVSQSSKDKAKLSNRKIPRMGGKNLDGNILSKYLKDPEFSYVGSDERPFEIDILDPGSSKSKSAYKDVDDVLTGDRGPDGLSPQVRAEKERVEREAGYVKTGRSSLNPNNKEDLAAINMSIQKNIKDRYK